MSTLKLSDYIASEDDLEVGVNKSTSVELPDGHKVVFESVIQMGRERAEKLTKIIPSLNDFDDTTPPLVQLAEFSRSRDAARVMIRLQSDFDRLDHAINELSGGDEERVTQSYMDLISNMFGTGDMGEPSPSA